MWWSVFWKPVESRHYRPFISKIVYLFDSEFDGEQIIIFYLEFTIISNIAPLKIASKKNLQLEAKLSYLP